MQQLKTVVFYGTLLVVYNFLEAQFDHVFGLLGPPDLEYIVNLVTLAVVEQSAEGAEHRLGLGAAQLQNAFLQKRE